LGKKSRHKTEICKKNINWLIYEKKSIQTFDLRSPQVEKLTIEKPKNVSSKNPGNSGKQAKPKGSCQLTFKIQIPICTAMLMSKYYDQMTNKLDMPGNSQSKSVYLKSKYING